MPNLNIGATYTFETHAPTVLGSVFKNVRVLGMFDHTVARNYINVPLMHASIYPLLPAGTVDDASTYMYVLFSTESGVKVVLAGPWIKENTIQEVTSITLTVVIHDINLNDVTRIQQTLHALGYLNVSLNVT